MTDESRSPSRRERREQELRAAARLADDTDAFPGAPISESIPTHSPDGRALTRRERRRLERARLPMETWTAEEEMIATGQIPAMTPERIAEQERIAREKAEAAQREAQTASSELGLLPPQNPATESLATDGRHGPASAASAPGPSAQSAPEPTVPQRTSLIPTPDSAPGVTDDGGPHAENGPGDGLSGRPSAPATFTPPPASVPSAQVASAPSAPAVPPPSAPSAAPSAPEPGWHAQTGVAGDVPVPDLSPESHAPPPVDHQASAVFGEQPQVADQWWEGSELPDDRDQPDTVMPPQEPAPEVGGRPAGMSPELFAALFPPGSLQRRLMEQQATEQMEQVPEEPEVEDPAAEIRRLTQQAVAGIDAASSRRQQAEAELDDPAAEAAARAVLPNAWGPAAEAVGVPGAPHEQYSEPSLGGMRPSGSPGEEGRLASAPSAPGAWDEPAQGLAASFNSIPASLDMTPISIDEPPVPLDQRPESLGQAPFEAILGSHPATSELDQVSRSADESHRPDFHDITGQGQSGQVSPHHAQFDVAQQTEPSSDQESSMWDAHPLMDVNRAAPVLPEVQPAQNIPQPDLSSVRRPSSAPLSDDLSSIEPVPTGQIVVPPRERPDFEAAGGPRHFKWAHLAVFGAVAFLLGVVVWNVAVRP